MVIDLGALVHEPAKIAECPVEAIPALLAQIAAEQSRLAALMSTLAARLAAENADHGPDHLLDVEQAAERLATTPDGLRERIPIGRSIDELDGRDPSEGAHK